MAKEVIKQYLDNRAKTDKIVKLVQDNIKLIKQAV